MWLAVLVLAVVATGFAIVRDVHMFQLNSYKPREQARWLAGHRTAWLPAVVAALIGVASLAWAFVSGVILVLWLLLVAGLSLPHPRRAKKPLVVTARVRRLLVTIGVVVAVLVVAAVVVPAFVRTLMVVAPFVLSPVLTLLANALNAPAEAAIRHRYLNDAKRRLAAQPGLIKIGITGSYGKTSVKYYLATLLKGHYNVLMTPESYNTPMGITKTIRGDLRATHEVFVCEMGAQHVGDIKEDCDLVGPTIGVITAIGEQHLASFGSQAAILRTKLELAAAVKGRGPLYLNGDNDLLRANQPDQARHLYGLGTDCDTYAADIAVTLAGTTFSLTHRGHTLTGLTTPLIGRHNIQNLTGAAAVALDLGVTEDELRAQLRKLAPAPHRLALRRQGNVTILDDAYNSNPAGAQAALDTLCLFDAMRIVITPGMVQLGERQAALNEAFGAGTAVADHVFLVGAKQTEPIAKGLLGTGYDPAKLTIVEDVQAALAQAYALPCDGDKVILLENDLPDNY
ncbi:MAG: UDP-N-acetylmuramoyl-tripeptide--D-alanyl-D-alanine ligase [Propionibacteriaceae bacterium]|jgi:UDP-N-acetylmuramoyl-tripeptide--D-alanyl-D-alanine ligase|nr:UDP-N-acetylmuramoyl-tripeptide--D-alanyl-D-alanine ligase [Propionibacteriaceae bacterium]